MDGLEWKTYEDGWFNVSLFFGGEPPDGKFIGFLKSIGDKELL